MYLWWGMEGGMTGMRLVRWKRDEVLFFLVKNRGSLKTISISHRKVNWSVYLTEWEQISRKMTLMLMKSERNFSPNSLLLMQLCALHVVSQRVEQCGVDLDWLALFLRVFQTNFKYLITWKTKKSTAAIIIRIYLPHESTNLSESLCVDRSDHGIAAFETDAGGSQYGVDHTGKCHQWKHPPAQHLPVMVTMAAGWQASNHPFSQQLCLESSNEVLSV